MPGSAPDLVEYSGTDSLKSRICILDCKALGLLLECHGKAGLKLVTEVNQDHVLNRIGHQHKPEFAGKVLLGKRPGDLLGRDGWAEESAAGPAAGFSHTIESNRTLPSCVTDGVVKPGR